jgi:DNA-binding PadR family transcriptional regulator
MRKITTTAYALLGLLSIRRWSSYEFAQHMLTSNLRAIWPRAESRIYEEPKRLIQEGLAESEVRSSGGRKRTVYRITRKGRSVLRKWLGEPSRRFRYRSEAMVKVSFADMGSLDDLRRNVEAVRREALEDAEAFLEYAQQVRESGLPFPERAHVIALVDEFILEVIESRIRWAHFAEDTTRAWTATTDDEATRAQGLAWWAATTEPGELTRSGDGA